MKKTLYFLFSLFVIFTLNCHAEEQKIAAAVMDLEAREGISPGIALILSDHLRVQLVNTHKFTIVTRENMEQILEEQKFQLSGCTSQECIIQVGQLLGVHKIFSGSVGKIGATYVIGLKVIDVESGKIERAESEQCAGCKEDALLVSIEKIVNKISSLPQMDKQVIKEKKEEKLPEEKIISEEKRTPEEGYSQIKIAPYYYLYTTESGFIADTSVTLSTSIYGDFAAKVIFSDRWSLLALYELNYQGPGATSDSKEGANFQEQYQDHSIILKPTYLLSENWILGGRIGYVVQLSKTGSTEGWNKGLYNYNGWTFGFDAKTRIKNIYLTPGYLFNQNLYPNYSNLIGYVQKTEARPEQDHYRHKFNIDATYSVLKNLSLALSLNDTIKTYAAQGVINESGVEDTSTKQLDNILGVKIDLSYLPLKEMTLELKQKMEVNVSNQNDLTFNPQNPADTTTTRFNTDYYSYTFYEISPVFTYTFPNRISFNLSYLWNIKNYHSRFARNKIGEWLSEKEWDITRQVDTGLSFPMGKFALGLYYTYINALSNMGYEQYYRYNYNAHNVKVSYSFEY